MPSKKLPWFKAWVKDILGDAQLKAISPSARCLWLYIMCLMHTAPRRGYLMQENRHPYSLDQLARIAGVSTDEAAHLYQELVDSAVFSVSEDGFLYSRRMVRESKISEIRSEVGKKGVFAKQTRQQKPSNGVEYEYLNSSSSEKEELAQPFGMGVQGEGGLLQQKSGKPPDDPADEHPPDDPIADGDELEASARRCAEAWRLKVLGRYPESLRICLDTFKAMLRQGHSEAVIIGAIPKEGTREWLKSFCDRLDKQVGIAPGNLFTRPAAATARFLEMIRKEKTA